jgi:hypothetical protein
MKRLVITLAVVFAVALAIRLITLAVLLPNLKPDVDLDSYRSLARNLVAGKGFVAISEAGQELPNVSRTPVYPLFLAAMMKIGGDNLGLFLAAQCVLGAVVCALTALLASRWLSWGKALAAGLLVTVDPNSVVRCVDLRTETLFTLLLIGGGCALAWRDKRWWGWMLGGFLWSLAAMCRPIAMWLWVVALILALTVQVRWPQRLLYFAAFLVAFLPLEGVWAARNARLTGRAFVSTISACDLLLYRAGGVVAAQTHQPLETVQQRFLSDYGDVQFFDGRATFGVRLGAYRRVALHIILSAPALVAQQTFLGWVKVLVGPGAHSIDAMLREPRATARWWPVPYSLGLLLVSGLSILGAVRLRSGGVLLTALVLYFVILVGGPESNSRFRAPITPMLAVLAVAAVQQRREPA